MNIVEETEVLKLKENTCYAKYLDCTLKVI